jgi:hypothetical protein
MSVACHRRFSSLFDRPPFWLLKLHLLLFFLFLFHLIDWQGILFYLFRRIEKTERKREREITKKCRNFCFFRLPHHRHSRHQRLSNVLQVFFLFFVEKNPFFIFIFFGLFLSADMEFLETHRHKKTLTQQQNKIFYCFSSITFFFSIKTSTTVQCFSFSSLFSCDSCLSLRYSCRRRW